MGSGFYIFTNANNYLPQIQIWKVMAILILGLGVSGVKIGKSELFNVQCPLKIMLRDSTISIPSLTLPLLLLLSLADYSTASDEELTRHTQERCHPVMLNVSLFT